MDIWRFVQHELASGHRVMLMVVSENSGSTPGRPGFKMAVSESGGLSGSIGGGNMEYNMVNLSRDLLFKNEAEPLAVRQIHDPKAGTDSSGLICSGMQVNLLFPLEKVHLEVVDGITNAYEQGLTGTLYINPDFMSFEPIDVATNQVYWEMQSEDAWSYTEHLGSKPVLTIFGGGHLSLPLSQICQMLGFKVVVFDDREGLNTMERNTFAHVKEVIDYSLAPKLVSEGESSYVAIMTVSHATDQMILGSLLGKGLKYLGMIGSKKKVDKIFQNLLDNGATEEQLGRVDSPMGIKIGSQTVEEIAVSIAAKIVQVKNS